MTRFRIPSHYQKGFELFFALKNAKRIELIGGIKNSKVGESMDQIINDVSRKVKINKHECGAMIDMLRGLYVAKRDSEMKLEEFVDSIVFALNESENKKLKPPSNLKQQLRQLLDDEHYFALTVKANGLAKEREKILIETSINTDIRPLFEGKKVKNAIIIHTLTVEYHHNHDNKETYFALSSNDLAKLKEQIIQAEKNELSIKGQLKLSFIDIK